MSQHKENLKAELKGRITAVKNMMRPLTGDKSFQELSDYLDDAKEKALDIIKYSRKI